MTITDITTRFEALKTERAKWEATWKDVTQVVNIRRQWWTEDDSSGKTPETKLYDTTATEALQTLSGGLQGYAVSPSFKFFKLKMADDKLSRLPFVADWLEEVENAIYSEFNKGNFYQSFDEFTKDAASIGTGFMYIEDDLVNNSIVFSCKHPKEAYIAEGPSGVVDTLYRKFMVPVRTLVQTFGLSKLDETLQTLYNDAPFTKVPVLHAVYPKDDKEGKSYESVYIDVNNQKELSRGGFDEFPYIVWRWSKNSDEVYGRGIGMDALPEILRLNQMAKTLLMAGELAVNPPLNVPMEMKGRERIVPKGYNYYSQMTGKVEPINLGANFPFGWQELMDQREIVKNRFHVGFFLMLEALQNAGKMTATEVMERQSEKAAVLGSIIGRMNSECLSPLIDRVFAILNRQQKIPQPPEELMRMGGKIDIEYMGPLAQAQKRFNQNQGVMATLGLIQSLVQIEGMAQQSQAIDNFNLDELAYSGAQAAGAPQKAIRESVEIEQLRAARAQALQAQQQQAIALEQQKALASNADKLNVPLQKGSMLDAVTGGGA